MVKKNIYGINHKMISILIPTYNNLDYLKLCLKSLKKNSSFNHEIIIHINEGSDGTLDFIKNNSYKHTSSDNNIGLCSSINKAAKLVSNKYILYSHDDMYFCPNWDKVLLDEVKSLNHDNFYLSGTMIEPNSGHIVCDFGIDLDSFKENELLSKYKNITDLSEKIEKISEDEKLRKTIGQKGKTKYMKYFNSTLVADFIINKTYEINGKKKYLWHKP